MLNIKLVEIRPLETRLSGTRGKHRYPAIVWFRDVKIRSSLDQSVIDRIIRETETKGKIHTITNPDNLLYWQYFDPLKPLIIIDKREEPFKVCTTSGTIEHFGLEKCEKQAAYVLSLLKKYGYAKFRRVTVSTYRLGSTEKERKFVLSSFKHMVDRHHEKQLHKQQRDL